jgi:hypothetical protein
VGTASCGHKIGDDAAIDDAQGRTRLKAWASGREGCVQPLVACVYRVGRVA